MFKLYTEENVIISYSSEAK